MKQRSRNRSEPKQQPVFGRCAAYTPAKTPENPANNQASRQKMLDFVRMLWYNLNRNSNGGVPNEIFQ